MTPFEIVNHCRKQIELSGPDAECTFVVPRSWRAQKRMRLGPPSQGGPFGEPVGHHSGGTVVMFKAREVIDWIAKSLNAHESTMP